MTIETKEGKIALGVRSVGLLLVVRQLCFAKWHRPRQAQAYRHLKLSVFQKKKQQLHTSWWSSVRGGVWDGIIYGRYNYHIASAETSD